MAQSITLPRSVIDTDHRLEAAASTATEDLAHHRWHHVADPDGPRFGLREYARAVGRNESTISKHVRGYEAWLFAQRKQPLNEAIELAGLSAERAEVAKVIAEVEGVAVTTVTHRRGTSDSLANITEQARERAERRGTTVVEEARQIGTVRAAGRAAASHQRQDRQDRHTARYIAIEGLLARAKRLLADALAEGAGVMFSDEEEELLRDSIANLRAVLNLIDMRVAGTPDIDWDAELANLGGAR